ncbi:MAG: secE [Dehalococcoidia bacterium]|nr:secE [Dehalococcoidia bacterium]
MKSRSPDALRKSVSARSMLRIFPETYSELKKVVWPNRKEIRHLTVIVLVVSLAVGLLLGLLDFGFAQLFNKVLLGR